MSNSKSNPRVYFHDIGAWPHASRSMVIGYVVGFILSLFMTASAYFVAVYTLDPSRSAVVAVILAFACIQFVLQMRYFLHIDFKPSSRTRLLTLGFAVVIVAILVSGSVWIMTSLNSRMMPSMDEMNQYMERQPGI